MTVGRYEKNRLNQIRQFRNFKAHNYWAVYKAFVQLCFYGATSAKPIQGINTFNAGLQFFILMAYRMGTSTQRWADMDFSAALEVKSGYDFDVPVCP